MQLTAIGIIRFSLLVIMMQGAMVAQDAADSSKAVKMQIFGQFWARYNESNPATMQQGVAVGNTFDIGIRRARVQALCTVNDRTTLFLHYGFNNMNTNFQSSGNRKIQGFFHDVFAEYRVSDDNALKLGAGLAFVNGLSRFSQPAVIAMPTADIPVFGQATVEQIDIFGRKLSLTARGQIGPIDYRIALSDPFPITTNGNAQQPLGSAANFAQVGHELQRQAYVIYQFMDHEPHQLPNMAGTYYGKRHVFNIGAGFMHQPRAMWRTLGADTLFEDMLLMAVESMYDAPIDGNGTTLSAYAGLFRNDYGRNYLRYNGIMNPGTANQTGLDSTQVRPLTAFGPSFGNAFPMFGTGTVFYAHLGVYFPNVVAGAGLMPYVSTSQATFDRLDGRTTDVYNLGCSLLLDGLRSRLTLDIQNRPTYGISTTESPFGELVEGARRTQVVMQYQVVW
ncbi:MAG: hypothetical protein FGM24_06980 [Candidatus Kapabacteria bacterium]|nr:hypothetical protein [Candidatus Kapabacteria bacterium]